MYNLSSLHFNSMCVVICGNDNNHLTSACMCLFLVCVCVPVPVSVCVTVGPCACISVCARVCSLLKDLYQVKVFQTSLPPEEANLSEVIAKEIEVRVPN